MLCGVAWADGVVNWGNNVSGSKPLNVETTTEVNEQKAFKLFVRVGGISQLPAAWCLQIQSMLQRFRVVLQSCTQLPSLSQILTGPTVQLELGTSRVALAERGIASKGRNFHWRLIIRSVLLHMQLSLLVYCVQPGCRLIPSTENFPQRNLDQVHLVKCKGPAARVIFSICQKSSYIRQP